MIDTSLFSDAWIISLGSNLYSILISYSIVCLIIKPFLNHDKTEYLILGQCCQI